MLLHHDDEQRSIRLRTPMRPKGYGDVAVTRTIRVLPRAASGPRLTDCTLFGSFPEPDRHTAASAKPSEFVPHRDFRSNGHYFPHI